jgi:hypothetical protein
MYYLCELDGEGGGGGGGELASYPSVHVCKIVVVFNIVIIINNG